VLGKTNVEVPILGLGADGIVTDGTNPDEVGRYLHDAMDVGVTFFDTAYVYGKDGQSEKNLGLLMGTERRKEAFLATKTGSRTYDGAMRQVAASLKRLRTDYLDLIQVHNLTARDDVKALGRPDGVLAALYKLRDQHVVRFVGLTGHPQHAEVREAIELFDWDTLMCFVNPARFSEPALREQLPLARQKGLGIIGMKTFGGRSGPLVGSSAGQADPASLLRFAWSHPVTLTIPGATSPKQLWANLDAAWRFEPMTPQEMEALSERINSAPRPWKR
jgi:aryl-alcohol dehydrogenase-like predicted oxidoreductase